MSVTPDGKHATEKLGEADQLEPGEYTLRAEAGAAIDDIVSSSGGGDASYDFTVGVSVLGDLHGGGGVGILDFLGLLAAWGPCPDPPADCPADLDGDGLVGITDFLILLANWG